MACAQNAQRFCRDTETNTYEAGAEFIRYGRRYTRWCDTSASSVRSPTACLYFSMVHNTADGDSNGGAKLIRLRRSGTTGKRYFVFVNRPQGLWRLWIGMLPNDCRVHNHKSKINRRNFIENSVGRIHLALTGLTHENGARAHTSNSVYLTFIYDRTLFSLLKACGFH